jgi:hypothetical protein
MRKDMILIYGECNKFWRCAFMQTINVFPKTLCFFKISFNQANCTADYVLCFLNQKTNIHVNFANVLWVAFSNSVGLIITREIPCIGLLEKKCKFLKFKVKFSPNSSNEY